jgi:hypothetical protein
MFFTFLLALSVVGIILLVSETIHYTSGSPDIHKSTWMQIGLKLLNNCE